MKFEEINGKQHIILEENDNVCLTTLSYLSGGGISIKNTRDKLDISGDSSVIHRISGKGMLEKVYLLPVLSSEAIIEKCDQWLEMFKQVHDKFSESALVEKYRQQNITMNLSFGAFCSFSDINKVRSIDLDMQQYGTTVQEGMTISLDGENEEVYKYLLANTLSHYLSKNYAGVQIDLKDFNWRLYSSGKSTIVDLSSLQNSIDYERIVTGLIVCHNVGASTEQIIVNCRNKICNQHLSNRIDEGIESSTRQYKCLTQGNEDKASVLKKEYK